MLKVDRKTFLRTLGVAGGGILLAGSSGLQATPPVSEHPGRTEPVNRGPANRVLRVAHLTDIHIKPEKIAEHGTTIALHEVNDMADKPDFIINGGDAIMNAVAMSKENVKGQWNKFNQVLKNENGLPVYNCIGNHDLFGWMLPSPDHEESKKWAMDEYGMAQSYYSFVKGNWKFIVLDSIHGRNSVPGYFGKLDDRQMDWLKAELNNTGDDMHICIVSHIPILAICCLFDGGLFERGPMKLSDNNMHADAQELTELFYAKGNVRACLSGHIHLIDYVNYLGTEYYCNGAVAGGWWKGDHQHFAPAYAVMNFYDDGSSTREVHYYKWKG